MVRWVILGLVAGCSSSRGEPTLLPLQVLTDCEEGVNETPSAASRLPLEEGLTGLSLCEGDVDWYRVDVPPGEWVSVELVIDGSGKGATDLDLVEATPDGTDLWASATEQAYERLAWFNPGWHPVARYLRVEGYSGASATYDLVTRVDDFHDGVLDCDSVYPEEDARSESGPCNEILQFPRAERESDGYFVEHVPHYSNLRREVAYLVRYAAQETYAAFPGTKPIALLDMSERDGSTPGTMVSSLRHPSGTHVYGNDIDIAYFQNGDDNAGRPVCVNDGYFCTGPASKMDARRTAFFLAKLFESPHTRVIGVDPAVAEAVAEAADALGDEGLLTAEGVRAVKGRGLAYGDGWPFHHHHLHFSWEWEDGVSYRSAEPGCLVEDVYAER